MQLERRCFLPRVEFDSGRMSLAAEVTARVLTNVSTSVGPDREGRPSNHSMAERNRTRITCTRHPSDSHGGRRESCAEQMNIPGGD